MGSRSGISSIVADIYKGAYNTALWSRTMEGVGDRFDAQFLMVGTVGRNNELAPQTSFYHVRNDRFDDALAEYLHETHRLDPTVQHVLQNPRGGTYDSVKEIGYSDYSDHSYVSWNLASTGSMFWTAHHGAVAGDLSLGIALHRSKALGPLSDEGSIELAMLFDHMRNALSLAARPQLIEDEEPRCILDHCGRVAAANEAAKVLFSASTALTISDGYMCPTHRKSAAMLNEALDDIFSFRRSYRAVSLQQKCGARLLCEVRALPAGTHPVGSMRPAAIVRLIDPKAAVPIRCDVWQSLFGLTPAEARLARALIESEGGLREAAMQLGVSYGTARVQLASAFTKTDVRNQSQFVRVLTRIC